MTKEKFSEILKEFNYPDRAIELLWDTRNNAKSELTEETIRMTARDMKHLFTTDPKLN